MLTSYKYFLIFIAFSIFCAISGVPESVLKSENKSSKIKIIDETYFEACDLIQVNNEECKFPEHAIGVHLYENSWLDTSDNIFISIVSFIVKYKYLFIFLIVFLILFFIVKPMKYFKKMKLFKFGKK